MPRYPGSIAKFKMLQHELVDQNPELTEVNEMSKRRKLENDGVTSVEYRPLYTSIKIRLRPPPTKVVHKALVCFYLTSALL